MEIISHDADAPKIQHRKTYKMNQIGIGLFGLTGVLLIAQKLGNETNLVLVTIFLIYGLLVGTPLITMLAIQNNEKAFIKFSKLLNYLLLGLGLIGNAISIFYSFNIGIQNLLSLCVFSIPTIANIRCLREIELKSNFTNY